MRVLDLGGTPRSWLIAPEMPAHVTTVNLLDLEQPDDDRITVVTGNACDPSDFVRNKAYDLVFSNSLMEHVGGHLPRLQLADVIAKSAPRYWVQTPYRYFPVEPHWVFPGMQFLPLKARAFVAQTWPGGNRDVSTAEQSIDDCEWVELLDITAMRSYFPDAVIWHERFAGLVKSIVAVKA